VGERYKVRGREIKGHREGERDGGIDREGEEWGYRGIRKNGERDN
jgi:hypothetical protein